MGMKRFSALTYSFSPQTLRFHYSGRIVVVRTIVIWVGLLLKAQKPVKVGLIFILSTSADKGGGRVGGVATHAQTPRWRDVFSLWRARDILSSVVCDICALSKRAYFKSSDVIKKTLMVDPLKILWVLTNSTYLGESFKVWCILKNSKLALFRTYCNYKQACLLSIIKSLLEKVRPKEWLFFPFLSFF